jgi:hypothetical protein
MIIVFQTKERLWRVYEQHPIPVQRSTLAVFDIVYQLCGPRDFAVTMGAKRRKLIRVAIHTLA